MKTVATSILPNTRAILPPGTFQTGCAAMGPAHTTTNLQFYRQLNDGLSIINDSYNPVQTFDMTTTAAGVLANSSAVHPFGNFRMGCADIPSPSHGSDSTERCLSPAINAAPSSSLDFFTNKVSSSMDNEASTPSQDLSIDSYLILDLQLPET